MKVAIIGECMVELYKDNKSKLFHQTFGGDTFNTAVYLKRKIPKANVEYITVLGKDELSKKMINFIQNEEIDTNYIEQINTRNAGLYIIDTKNGERTFTYYRDKSAAKKLFTTVGTNKLSKDLEEFDLIYFSAITLAIMNKEGRDKLFETLKKARKKGSKIVFDSNYRPRLYKNRKKAQKLYIKALKHSDVFLPSIDDEALLWGRISSDEIIKRAKDLKCKEVVIKCGKKNIIYNKKSEIKSNKVKDLRSIIDTTAAGDSFNGTYLASRLKKYSKQKSIDEAKKIAARVIMHQGAIIPKDKE